MSLLSRSQHNAVSILTSTPASTYLALRDSSVRVCLSPFFLWKARPRRQLLTPAAARARRALQLKPHKVKIVNGNTHAPKLMHAGRIRVSAEVKTTIPSRVERGMRHSATVATPQQAHLISSLILHDVIAVSTLGQSLSVSILSLNGPPAARIGPTYHTVSLS